MTYISIPCAIAPFGHSGSQTSQLMHSSVIIKAISRYLFASSASIPRPWP